jgi:hypothetical protein
MVPQYAQKGIGMVAGMCKMAVMNDRIFEINLIVKYLEFKKQ